MIDPTKSRREQRREDTHNEIKEVARRQMAEHGTATLSLRAIALEMKITAPAIYRYFESRDALITALIVDAFNALADALELARDNHPNTDPVERLAVVMLAYREWAITHPSDFQLIYGNPIPGYHAPREVTVPAVVRGFVVTIGLLREVMQTYPLRLPYTPIPEELRAHFEAMVADGGYPITEEAFYVGMMMWTQFHGIIMLELFNHIQANVGDVDLYYRTQMKLIFKTTLNIDL
jgi:AcrR family transcriptional regulator